MSQHRGCTFEHFSALLGDGSADAVGVGAPAWRWAARLGRGGGAPLLQAKALRAVHLAENCTKCLLLIGEREMILRGAGKVNYSACTTR